MQEKSNVTVVNENDFYPIVEDGMDILQGLLSFGIVIFFVLLILGMIFRLSKIK